MADYSKLGSPPAYMDEASAPPHTEMNQYAPQYDPQAIYPPLQPPAQVPPPQVAPPQVVHHTTTVVVNSNQRGMVCPQCNARIRVRTEFHPTGKTYCLAALLCLFLCWPCVCVPCCCNCCYKTSQFCPNCNACLGSF
ncbi:GL11363 [Drosophila persimilis]|uniref:GL11363 n=1 Tax=Drosophila persimilis TaxID=7234 RepID=B4GAF2_DROPE|nr:lipopolysaccharide-induced tumor necrosis factor-alpha factor homolog [Drosophila persimilis]XP_026842715.1 lipopolysaccharide-induced tumor necrosis factor-alpha factor homolog [Drosophila persimilis]EDW31904.1 GL11363 [Drosophila persimilis]